MTVQPKIDDQFNKCAIAKGCHFATPHTGLEFYGLLWHFGKSR
ncbi:MAG: hypothetical protein ACTS2F_08860 [Thainema sp.]